MSELVETPSTRFLKDLAATVLNTDSPQYLIIITDNPSTNEEQIMKAIINEANPNPALIMDPFNVGEIINQSTPINGASPFPHRPHGIITFAGDVEAVVKSLQPWINPEAKVEADDGSWNWADAIEEGLRSRGAVNFDELPVGVIFASLPEAISLKEGEDADEPVSIPDGWTGQSLMEAVFAQKQLENTGVDRR